MDSNKIRPPQGLGPRGRAVWREITTEYVLTPTERQLLHTLCSTLDQLSRIELGIKGLKQLTTTGSKDQVTAHPLLAEHRAHAESLRRLARQLGLPDDSTLSKPRRSKVNANKVSHLTNPLQTGVRNGAAIG